MIPKIRFKINHSAVPDLPPAFEATTDAVIKDYRDVTDANKDDNENLTNIIKYT